MPRREHRRSLSHASGRYDHVLVMVVELVESVTQRHRAYRASSGARLECGSWCAWPRRRRLARPRADSWSDCAVFGWHRVWPERTGEDPNSISQVSRPRELRPLDAPSACSRSTRSDRMSSSFCRARGSALHPSGFARAGVGEQCPRRATRMLQPLRHEFRPGLRAGHDRGAAATSRSFANAATLSLATAPGSALGRRAPRSAWCATLSSWSPSKTSSTLTLSNG